MNLLLILLLVGGGYLALRSSQTGIPIAQGISDVLASGAGGVSLGAVSFAAFGPNSDPRNWYNGMKPGTVSVGGQKAPAGWDPTGDNLAGSASKAGRTTGTIVGSVSAIGTTGIFGTSGLSIAIGGALPVIGIAIAGVVTILSIIGAHHQAALAAEGKALNDADPRSLNAMVMVLQAVLAGEITSVAVAQQHLIQIVQDWYGEVRTVQRGTWHYTGQDLTADFEKVWIKRTQPPKGAPGYSDYHAPDPCNGACVIGHFFTERNQFLVMAAVRDALAGNHGQLILPEIPAHDTQIGFPLIEVTY